MRLFAHIRWLGLSLRPGWAWHYWRLLVVLLVVVCISAEPIASGISCQTVAPFLSPAQPARQSADVQAHAVVVASQPGYTLIQIVAPTSETSLPDVLCSYVGSGAPRGAMVQPLFLDKIVVAVGLALFSIILLRHIPLDALRLPPLLRFPPPTPPPITAFSI